MRPVVRTRLLKRIREEYFTKGGKNRVDIPDAMLEPLVAVGFSAPVLEQVLFFFSVHLNFYVLFLF